MERKPYVAGSQALMDKRPRIREEVEPISLPEANAAGGTVVIHPDTGEYLELSSTETEIGSRLDGSRTIRELVMEGLGRKPPLGVEKIGLALLRFARDGLLAGAWDVPVRRAPGIPIARVSAQSSPDGAFRVFVLFFLALLPLLGLFFLGGAFRERGFHLLPAGGSAWGIVASILILASWRQAVRGCAVLLSGREIASFGIGLPGWVPGLYVDTSSMILAPLELRVRLELAGLYSCLALSSIAALLLALNPAPLPESFLMQLAAVGLLGLFADVSPLHDTDGYGLYGLLSRQPHLRERAFDFLSRKLASKLGAERFTDEERALLVYGLSGLLWAAAALAIGVNLHADMNASAATTALLHDGPGERVALAVVLAGVLAAVFHALALLVWVPLSWLLRPVGRRILPTLVMPVALALGSGLALLSEPTTAWLVASTAAFAALFPLLRARKTFAGSPLQGAVFALAAFAACRFLTGVAGGLQSAGLLTGAIPSPETLGLLARLSPAILLGVTWKLIQESRLAPPSPAETFLVRVLWTALGLVAAWGLWRRPDSIGAADALALVGATGAAVAAIPVLLAHAAAPARQIWRPLGTGLLAFAAAAACGFTDHSSPWPAWVTLRWEAAGWPLVIAAVVASRLWLHQGWRRPMNMSRTANTGVGQRETLLVAAQVNVANQLELFALGLGRRKADGLVREFNRRAERELHGEVLLVEGELDVARWTEQGLDWLCDRLGRSLEVLESVMAERSGRRFTEWARCTALADLYWFEQELLKHHLPKRLPCADGGLPAAQRLEELTRVPFFSLLGEDEFGALVRIVRLQVHPAGDIVVRQGDPADCFYVVARGELTVLREDASGHEEPLGHLLAGDCFGESAFVRGGRRMATVIASENVELYALGRGDLEILLAAGDRITGTLETLVGYGGFLRNIPMFSVLPASEIGKLAALLVAEEHPQKKVLLKPGEPIDRLYLIQEGEIGAYSTGKKGKRMRESCMSIGQHFGAEALLEGISKNKLLLVTESRVRLLTLSRDRFDRAMAGYLDTYTGLVELATPRAELE